jgi:DNA invertase Pin-like site-specific DNA recombinase
VQTLQARDVPVLAISGPKFDLSTPHSKMIASVMAALAEFERDFIRERIKSGIAAEAGLNYRLIGPPCQAQQNPPTEQSCDASDTHSGRVSAARSARDEHSTLARHGFWSQSDP